MVWQAPREGEPVRKKDRGKQSTRSTLWKTLATSETEIRLTDTVIVKVFTMSIGSGRYRELSTVDSRNFIIVS